MTILCIETSTQVCSAAICVDGQSITSRINRVGGNHAKLLPVFIEELLTELRQRHATLDAVALSDGPGSYTGLRIGASTAKGISYGLNIPLIPIRTTEVLCATFLQQSQAADTNQTILCPMIDARRMEVYTACYNTAIQELTPITAQVISDSTHLAPHSLYFGDGAAKCQPFLETDEVHLIPDIIPDAACMGALAEKKSHAQQMVVGKDLAYYEPFYLKQFVAAQSHVKGLQ